MLGSVIVKGVMERAVNRGLMMMRISSWFDQTGRHAAMLAFVLGFLLVAVSGWPTAWATHDEVLLTVTAPDGSRHALGYADLERLPVTGFETTTPWNTTKQSFEGVSLADLLASLGIDASGEAEAGALNDYKAKFKLKDAVEHGAIIAYRLDGRHFGVRDKGPLWLIYPIDTDPVFRTDYYINHMVWQLISLKIEE